MAATEKRVIGAPMDEETDIGPVVDLSAAKRIVATVEDAVQRGGQVATGGSRDGAVVAPTVVDRVPKDSDLWMQEIFGPVVGVASYRDFSEAIQLANDSALRIHAGVFTKAMTAAQELEFGDVLINEVPSLRVDQQPYGATGGAGNTREDPKYAIEEMTELSVVSLPT